MALWNRSRLQSLSMAAAVAALARPGTAAAAAVGV
eukprot:COSAG06_NODE_48393_length_332_cov_0.939914_1_plen_34_part_01